MASIPDFGTFRAISPDSSSIVIPGSIDVSKKISNTRQLEYEDGVRKYRREKGLPDPFSNMSFAGVDINATMVIPDILEDGEIGSTGDVIELAELQTISYSMHRENSPVRTLGHVNPRGFVKGPRTIAGSLIFTVFNEYAFYRIKQFKRKLAVLGYAPLADMLPPFDIVLTFFNEYGLYGKMKIYGLTIVDEGQTMSVDDLITEQTYTYMARGIQPLIHYDPTDDFTYPDDIEKEVNSKAISEEFFGNKLRDYTNVIDKTIRP
jgi:hypothetical protein